ncbi:hypothetical protein ACFY40_24470 [Streptomyces sp. NPDC012950]|uniref:hypothetical protein n=1 Tax=Streptomyces sp. NPDC012950 TaxID=3364858 RepID=UPI00368C417E
MASRTNTTEGPAKARLVLLALASGQFLMALDSSASPMESRTLVPGNRSNI